MTGRNRNILGPRLALALVWLSLVSAIPSGSPLWAQGRSPFNAAPIHYATAPESNPLADLAEMLQKEPGLLQRQAKHGYLKDALRKLKIDPSSQVLVYSKTSFQRRKISVEKPRAIFFNDDVYLGWIPDGDVIELSAADPQLGAVFYTLDQSPGHEPRLTREIENCMMCHSSPAGARVPGHIVRSIHSNQHGYPIAGTRSSLVDHRTPINRRWGGWYVTGNLGQQIHLGNRFFPNKAAIDQPPNEDTMNLADVRGRVNDQLYLTPHSDVVALLVLEHQVQMHNVLTAACYETKRALADEADSEAAENLPDDPSLQPITRVRIGKAAQQVVEYLLFCDEAPVAFPITGSTSYAQQFAARGPAHADGRSLRQFDLQQRLFKYRCSYVIYSKAFTDLPRPLHDKVVSRLVEILSSPETEAKFAHLEASERAAILDILVQTHPSFAHLTDRR